MSSRLNPQNQICRKCLVPGTNKMRTIHVQFEKWKKILRYKREKKKKKLYGPFLWMGFNCLKARATSRRQFISMSAYMRKNIFEKDSNNPNVKPS